MNRLSGRRVVVTGGAEGIGAAIVRAFVAESATVAVLDRDAAAGAHLAEDAGVRLCAVDLSDVRATREAMEKAIARLGGIDVLVNVARRPRFASLLEMDPAELGDVFAMPTQAMLVTTQAAACAMVGMRVPGEDAVGKVVNVVDVGGALDGCGGRAHDAAAKAAVMALTRAAASELGPHGITVNCLCHGYLLDDAATAARDRGAVAAWSALSPLGRVGEPQDVARAALFLASSDSDYLTGDALNVTGGLVLH